MKHRQTLLGVSLVFVGLSLMGQLSVALLPLAHPVRIAVQTISIALVAVVGILLYAMFKRQS